MCEKLRLQKLKSPLINKAELSAQQLLDMHAIPVSVQILLDNSMQNSLTHMHPPLYRFLVKSSDNLLKEPQVIYL